MKTPAFGSGLLSVFRLFTGIRLALAIITLIGSLAGFRTERANLDEHLLSALISLFESGLLFIYLSLPGLARRLNSFYLPLALGVATVGPMLSGLPWLSSLSIESASEMFQIRAGLTQWQLVIVLLLPLILVAWEYGLRAVFGYAMITAAGDLLLMGLTVGLAQAGNMGLFLAGSALIFRTLFYLLIGYAITRLAAGLRQQNRELEEANRRLTSYAMTLEQLAVSRERNRLARELHDTLAHTLSGLAVELEAVQALWETEPVQARRMAGDALSQTRGGLNEARRAIQALRAAPLEDLGLRLGLETLVYSQAERSGLQAECHLPETLPSLSPEAEHALYRVAEEALRNAAQHARARTVQLTLEETNNPPGLRLTVADDGVGFDSTAPPDRERFGLRGMQERAADAGGQFSIHSQVGQGTRVEFWLRRNA